MSFTVALTILLSFLLPLWIMLMKKRDEHKSLPPGPKKLPIIGNLHQLSQPIHQSFQRLSDKHGSLMHLQLGSVPTLVVSSAAMAQEVLKTHDLTFASRPTMYATKKLSYNGTNISLAPYGKYWREVRKIALVELLSAKRVESFEAIRKEEVAYILKIVQDSTAKSTPVNLSELMFVVVNNIILRSIFSKKGNQSEEKGKSSVGEFSEILNEMEELASVGNIADSFPWMGWYNKFNGFDGRLEKNFRALDGFYDMVIQEHRQQSGGSQHEDLVDVLLRIQNDPSQEIRLTDENIKGIITDMFVAGSHSSSSTLVWMMAELMKNPSAMRKAQEEVRGVVNKSGSLQVKERHLPELVYLKMIVKEVLRLHPPIPLLVPHESTERCSIAGYDIPAMTRMLINCASTAKDSEYWEDPEEFKPERFLNSDIDFRGRHFEFLPFGAGRRGCPGINFAAVILEFALANLLHDFEWNVPDGARAEDIDMEESFGIAVHKKTPLCLVASTPSMTV
ncbi:hypothetical protein DCAR_0624892 [Daucus carota subsp. sativus]|uniref:Uncharacterized protein n=1 Tax=Daucus carota subsp. sativus TaxID=79200 RepID=A0A161YEH6_DAUCS|nr:PREDICTED: cytochrome P450 71A9-like [Daucus carota subsp. sativus]WOH05475.1 hypothetical protein DCAR_0624892 [Daucus carota subsp. sativus]